MRRLELLCLFYFLWTLEALKYGEFQGIADWGQPYPLSNGFKHYYGDIRAAVKVTEDVDAVQVRLEWRRRDPTPEQTNVEILNPYELGQPTIKNVIVMERTRESAIVVFQPEYGPGEYHIYYMPYSGSGEYLWVNVDYDPYNVTASADWLQTFVNNGKYKNLPKAEFLQFQSRTSQGRFDVMEFIALQSEVLALTKKYPQADYFLFPDTREHAIRMTNFLPMSWAQQGPSNNFTGVARLGEFYVFQVGLFAVTKDIAVRGVTFTDLIGPSGKIPSQNLKCFNTGGIDFEGDPFNSTWIVPMGTVNSLFCGVQVELNLNQGDTYSGSMKIDTDPPSKIALSINVSMANPVPRQGTDDLWRLSRLNWLDSTKGRDRNITKPYTPLIVTQNSMIYILNKRILLGNNGLPETITVNGKSVLSGPVQFNLIQNNQTKWNVTKPLTFSLIDGYSAKWNSTWRTSNGSIEALLLGECFYDGYINMSISITALTTINLKDIQMTVPYTSTASRFLMGMRNPGGFRKGSWIWNWVQNEGSNMIWMGDFDVGMRLKLKGTGPSWENPQNSYTTIPPSWGNNGLGGCIITDLAEVIAYSGKRLLNKGQSVVFHFDFMPTPVKPLDNDHWSWRYYQMAYDNVGGDYHGVDEVLKFGANIINVHQGVEGWINPNINYPFRPITVQTLSNYTAWGHQYNLKVKFYYTIRELSMYTEEVWALRTLNGEVFLPGNGSGIIGTSGDAWILEHIVDNYQPCWNTPLINGEFDSALCDSGIGRWTNYYVEGLARSVSEPVNIDGIYFDGLDFTRDTMMRIRKVLDDTRSEEKKLIDLHGANLDNPDLTPWKTSTANAYTHLFPFVDSIWFGEGFNYSKNFDYWLVAISGLPFGMFSEILGPGNPYYGMVFGMTQRYLFNTCNPKPIWDLWDSFGINQSQMIGWWDPECPVVAEEDNVMATVYKRENQTLIAIANWNTFNISTSLTIDWDALGLDQSNCILRAPAISKFQPFTEWDPSDEIPIATEMGWLIIVEPQS